MAKTITVIAALFLLITQHASAQELMEHPVAGSGRVSLSADGNRVLTIPWGSPANSLTLVDLSERTARRLKFEDSAVMLTEPSLSPDGGSVAVVARLNKYGPPPELWVIDINTGLVKRLQVAGRSIVFPVFSSDGGRVAYAAEIGNDYRRRFLFYEQDIVTYRTEPLSDRRFGSVCSLFYDPDDNGFFYCANEPVSDDDRFAHNFDYEDHIGSTLAFAFRRGEQISPWPTPVVAADENHQGVRIVGVTSDGEILVRSHPPTQFPAVEFTHDFARAKGSNFTPVAQYVSAAGIRSNIRASSTGELFVFETECGSEGRPGLALVRATGAECMPFESLRWDGAVVLEPPLNSAFVTPVRSLVHPSFP